MRETVYSTVEAAQYVGLSTGVFKYHVYQRKHITPDLRLGRELGFYQSTLDAFMRDHLSKDLTMKEAADYLGVSLHRMRHHVLNLKTIEATGRRGQYSTFSLAALEAARPVITAEPTAGRKPKAQREKQSAASS